MGRIILVRHGQTQMNADKLFFGKLDPSLTELGREQLFATLEKLKNLGITYDNIYSSDLKRAKESAEIINYLDKKIIFDKRLQEIDFGIFEGLNYEEILEKYPDEMKESEEDWENYDFETGESPKHMQKRAVKFMKSLNKTKNNLVVTHWGVICSILSYVVTEDMASYWKFTCDNGGIVIIEFADSFPFIKALNI